MARRSTPIGFLAGALALFIIIILILSLASHSVPLPVGFPGISGLRMTEEVQPPEVLYSTTLNLEPGTVWQVSYDAYGIHLSQRSSQLIERINLSNIDLSLNDVVAWHGFVIYASPGQYISFPNPRSSATNSIAWQVMVKLVRSDDSGNNAIFRPPESPRLDVETNTHYIFTFYDNATGYGELVSKPAIDYLDGRWHVITASHHNGLLNTWYDGEHRADDLQDNGDAKLYNSVSVGPCYGGGFIEMIAYAIVWKHGNSISGSVDPSTPLEDLEMLIDPTFFNGTHYIDLANNAVGTPYNGISRVPAQQTWLWLIKGLENDNRLHLKFVPPDSVFRIRYGGMVYEWRVTGEPNAAGLIEDYPIDIASIFGSTVLPNATVELIYDSQKVRFYVPSGFQVVVEGNGWSETHDVPLNSSYVDFGLPSSGTYTVKILGYRAEPRVGIETAGDVVRVTVTDEAGYAIPGAKVYVYDGSSLVATGMTNDLGMYEFNKTLLSGDQIRVVVSALKDGVYYHVDKVEMIGSSGVEQVSRVGEVAAVHSNANNGVVVAVLIILGLVVLAAIVLARGRRR